MKAIILSILYILNPPFKTEVKATHPCDMDLTSLSVDYQIKIHTGCSSVNGYRVYRDHTIIGLYKEALNEGK